MNEFEIVFRYEMLQAGKRLAAEIQQQYALGVVAREVSQAVNQTIANLDLTAVCMRAANAIDQAANTLSK